MASFPIETSSSGSVPIQCNEGDFNVLLPAATSPAQEDVLKGETIRIIPTILIEKGGLIFMNGARTLAEDIPSWLGHDAIDDISGTGNENETEVETRTWKVIERWLLQCRTKPQLVAKRYAFPTQHSISIYR